MWVLLAASAAAEHAEQETLGATGWEWRERLSMLHGLRLQPVVQYAAACGLHPDLVTQLALLELACGPPEFASLPLTWDAWVAQAQDTGRSMFSSNTKTVCMPTTPQGESLFLR